MSALIRKLRRKFFDIWMKVPYGYLLRFKGDGGTITVTKNLYVIVSDGSSSDALPLNFCSQELVDVVEQKLINTYGLEN